MTVRPAKTHISLGIRPVWSDSSLTAWRKLGPIATHWVDSEDSDQTGQMPRLIWVFAGRTATLLVLSWGCSNFIVVICFSWKEMILSVQSSRILFCLQGPWDSIWQLQDAERGSEYQQDFWLSKTAGIRNSWASLWHWRLQQGFKWERG